MKFNTNDKEKDHPSDTHDFKITSTDIWMGQLVREYTLQPELITLLNTEIDRRKDHPKWNEYLAGNIKDQYNNGASLIISFHSFIFFSKLSDMFFQPL